MHTNLRRAGVQRRRWTKKEYYRLGEMGLFHGQRVELIEGQLMVFSPQNALHANSVLRVSSLLQGVFQTGYHIRPQVPLDLGQTTEPEPDIAVVAGTLDQQGQTHPTSAVLIVEISDTTVSYDRRRKGSLYARAGIADYWIVNLNRRQLEVYRVPIPDTTARYGFRYSTRTHLFAGGTVSPLAMSSATIPIADLLPA